MSHFSIDNLSNADGNRLICSLLDTAVTDIEQDILQKAAPTLPNQSNYWRWFCGDAYGIDAIPLPSAPPDWNHSILGRFQGRLIGDPRDPESTCLIEYLAVGSSQTRIARILHELAEYVLLLRFSDPAAIETVRPLTLPAKTPDLLRHEAASRIEHALIARIFPRQLP